MPDFGTRAHRVLLIFTLILAAGIMLFCAISYFKSLCISVAKISVLYSPPPSEQPLENTWPIAAVESSL